MTAAPASASRTGEKDTLEFWAPRRALTLDAARKHSVRVRFARRVLILAAAALAGSLVWYFVAAPKQITPTDSPDETVKMVNPIYKGRTADGLAYRITASDAVRFIDSPDEVQLSAPVLNFRRNAGAQESVLLAEQGIYNTQAQILELRQNVDLSTDNGYACQTSHARVDVSGKRIEGDEAISCQGAFGQAGGNAYEINEAYTEYVFKNGITARINPKVTDQVLAGADNAGTDKERED